MESAKTELAAEKTAEENTPANKPASRSSRKSALDFRKYTKQIWLAGLGAFSRAEEEGNKLFDSLVKVGEELESKTSDVGEVVAKSPEKARASVHETKDRIEKLIDHSVQHSLNRIGLATSRDVQHLEQLILQLHQKVDALAEENRALKQQSSGK